MFQCSSTALRTPSDQAEMAELPNHNIENHLEQQHHKEYTRALLERQLCVLDSVRTQRRMHPISNPACPQE